MCARTGLPAAAKSVFVFWLPSRPELEAAPRRPPLLPRVADLVPRYPEVESRKRGSVDRTALPATGGSVFVFWLPTLRRSIMHMNVASSGAARPPASASRGFCSV